MTEHLQHLWPNFAALTDGSIEGISALIWLLMIAIVSLALIQLIRHWLHYAARSKALHNLLAGQTKENLALKRREILQQALTMNARRGVGPLWREFDESLVSSGDHAQLFNTLDAEHFFNPRTLAPGLTASRLLAATPGFLVAIGLLGTFVGLTIGLESLKLNSDDVASLKSGIDQMIGGAAIAFMTSVWGVFLSLVFNVVEKMFERNSLNGIRKLQQKIDFLYPRIPAEQSLVHIAEYGKESKEALQELHERIGDRLQETIQGMSSDMQRALTDALNNIMGPAIESLVNASQKQSSEVIGHLVGNFMEGMTSAGREQGNQMQRAAAEVNAAVSAMNERFNQLAESLGDQQARNIEVIQQHSTQFEEQLQRIASATDQREQRMEQCFSDLITSFSSQLDTQINSADQREQGRQQRFNEQLDSVASQQQFLLEGIARAVQATQEQSRQIAEQHQQLLIRLQQGTEAVAASSKHMESSANQLGLLSGNVRQAAEVLGEHLEAVTQSIEGASSQNIALAEQLQNQATSLSQIQGALLEGAQRFEQAASDARNGFGEMKQHQQEFLLAVRKEFTSLGDLLREQVEGIEKQAEHWLSSYSRETGIQVDERMNQWNRQTQEFVTQMLAAVQAISNVVDELEAR